MKKFFSFLLWTVIFLILLAGTDQLLLRAPVSSLLPDAVASFYRDFRSRIFTLIEGTPAILRDQNGKTAPAKEAQHPTVEGVIEQNLGKTSNLTSRAPAPSAKRMPHPPGENGTPRYVYADERGELHFAETLVEIPEQYRKQAKVLGK